MNINKNLCVHCAKIGVASTVTTLYINFNETINLCNNNMCLHPLGIPVTDNNSPSTKCSVPQSLDFSDIDYLLNAPADDKIADLVSALNAGTCGNAEFEKPPSELTPTNNIPLTTTKSLASVECAKRLVNSQIETGVKTHVLSISKFPNKTDWITTCISQGPTTPKPIITKNGISLTKSSEPDLQRKRRFPCFQNSIDTHADSRHKRKPAHPKTNTRTSTSVKSRKKDITQPNIFTFSEAVTSKSNNKKRSAKPGNSSVDASSQSSVSDGANHSLVRQWLAKQSPGRAYPGYGVKSTSLRGTSDGRSATDSVPPSPASLD